MKNSKKILMVMSAVAVMTLSGCAAYDPQQRLYSNSPEFKAWERSLQADDYEYERDESVSHHIINGKSVLRVGNRVYVR